MPAPGSSAAPSRRFLPRGLGALLLAALATAVYLNTLDNGFVFDDRNLVVENPLLRDWANIPHLFRAAWRPLKRLSLMVDYHLWGLDPAGYHATNIAFHVLAVLALAAAVRAFGGGERVAFLAAALFAVHPVTSEAVAVITHRKEMMGTLFLLLGLAAHARLPPSPLALVATFGLFAASLLSKETVGATFPLLLVAYDLWLRPGDRRQSIRRAALIAVPLGASIAAFLAFRLIYQGKPTLFPFFGGEHIAGLTDGVVDWYPPILATALADFWIYVRILIFPFDLSAHRWHPWVASPLAPAALAAIAGIGLTIGLAARCRRRQPMLALGLVWLPLTILPIANVVPLTPWFLAERFLYLPAAGFAVALAAGLEWLMARSRLPAARLAAAGLFVGLLAVYSGVTLIRNRDWRSDWTIWNRTLRQNPDSILARVALAGLLKQRGRIDEAADAYREVLLRSPVNEVARNNLGEILVRRGRFEEATELLEESMRLYPDNGKIHNNLGNAYKAAGRAEEALREYRLAAHLDPKLAEARVNLGAYLAKQVGDLDAAARSFEAAIEIEPGLAVAHFNLALVRRLQGDDEEARRHYRRVLELPAEADLKAAARRALGEIGRPGSGAQ